MPPRSTPPLRSVLVVGGTSGIGLALAERLAARGTSLTLAARGEGRLDDAAARLRERYGVEVRTAVADVADAGQVRDAVAAAASSGPLDAVVTTAQAMAYGTVEAVPSEVLEAALDTAVLGTAHLATATLPVFRAQGHGHLLVVGSLLAQIAVPGMSSYCAAKAAQLMLVRSLQLETRSEPGLRVSMVSPGAVDTPIYRRSGHYGGPQGVAPPPVVAADTVAHACERVLLDPSGRGARNRQVGVLNPVTVLGYRAAPGVYDRLAPWLVRHVVRRGTAGPDSPGNVIEPSPGPARVSDGWTTWGRRRQR